MKKIILTTGTVLGIACSTLVAFADSDDVKIPQAPQFSAVAHSDEKIESSFNDRMYRHMATTTALNRMKAQGDRLIKERLALIEANKTAINASKLAEAQKTAINNQLAPVVSGLTALRATIASSTDASSTKALVNSIFTQYRVYGIVLPQIRLEKRIYELQNHADTLASSTFAKVQTKIDEAKSKGKDVTVWQKSLDDAKALVTKDVTTLASLLTQAQALTPASYGTTTKATIESMNASIKAINRDFNTIGKLVHRPEFMKNLSRKVVGNGQTTSSSLFGTSWTWVSATEGATTTVPKNDKFVILFGEDNHVSSKTDCNSLMGSYTLNGSSLMFSPLAMTMMFCDGSQETVYAGLLGKVTGFSIDGNTLTLTIPNGKMLFTKK